MIKTKKKGTAAERELLHKFWDRGWACVRAAGSGSTSFPSPDLLAGNSLLRIALECKTLKKEHKYFDDLEISQLKEFSGRFGAEPWIAVKFDRKPWYLLKVEDLNRTKQRWGLSWRLIKEKGISFEDFILKNQKI